MNLLISDTSQNLYIPSLQMHLIKLEPKTECISANDLEIRPCSACSSCSGKTYGRCVIQDDMQKVYPLIVKTQKLIFETPVRFGGPSFHIKKIIDRMVAVGDPRYYFKNGELVKGMTGQGFELFMVGTGDGLSPSEREGFATLHEEICHIMGTRGRVFFLEGTANESDAKKVAEDIVHGT